MKPAKELRQSSMSIAMDKKGERPVKQTRELPARRQYINKIRLRGKK